MPLKTFKYTVKKTYFPSHIHMIIQGNTTLSLLTNCPQSRNNMIRRGGKGMFLLHVSWTEPSVIGRDLPLIHSQPGA
jgi:hypothetical protein